MHRYRRGMMYMLIDAQGDDDVLTMDDAEMKQWIRMMTYGGSCTGGMHALPLLYLLLYHEVGSLRAALDAKGGSRGLSLSLPTFLMVRSCNSYVPGPIFSSVVCANTSDSFNGC